MCMCHIIVLRKQAYQCFPTSTFFPQLWCQGLIAASGINLNTLFVTLNLQINPSSHTHIYELQLGRDVTSKVFFVSLRCFEQHLSVLLLYPLAPGFPMILLWTPPHAKLPSTSGDFCSIMHGGGIKTVDAMASPFQSHVWAPGRQWRASVTRNRAPRLATHTSREWGVCVRSTVSNREHLWPLGCGDRGQWWPRGSRRALARVAKARHRL